MYKIRVSPQDLGYLRLFLDLVADENQKKSEKSNVRDNKRINNNNLIRNIQTKSVSENN